MAEYTRTHYIATKNNRQWGEGNRIMKPTLIGAYDSTLTHLVLDCIHLIVLGLTTSVVYFLM